MYFEDFKLRTINLLNALDANYFAKIVNAIERVIPVDTSGFEDISAKALILFMALHGLLINQYYHQLEDKKKLLLARNIYDDLDKRVVNIHLKKDKHIAEAKKKLKELTHFFQQKGLETIYANRQKNKKFFNHLSCEELNKALRSPDPDQHSRHLIRDNDVDVEKSECFDLKQPDFVGTSSLVCCVAVCIYGKIKTNDNQSERPVLCIGHFSAIEYENIKYMMEDYDIIPGSEEIYLIGGSVSSITDLTNLLLNTELAIHDMHVCITDALVDPSSVVVIDPSRCEELHYLLTKSLPPRPAKNKRKSDNEKVVPLENSKRQQIGFFNRQAAVDDQGQSFSTSCSFSVCP